MLKIGLIFILPIILMKIALIFLIASCFGAYVDHTFTMGLPWQDAYYEYINYRYDGDLSVGLLFTTDHLATITEWYQDLPYSGFENSFDSFYENGMNNLYLQFEIYWEEDINDI